jgi:hypothetical protein
MEKDLIQSLLAEVISQLNVETPTQRKALDSAIPEIAKALRFQPGSSISSEKLTIQSADFFFTGIKNKALSEKVEKASIEAATIKSLEPDEKVFVREVPVRTTQVSGSVPTWAIGAKVDKTIGPIKRLDGREIFIDVYRVEKLISLRKQGTNEPLIFFKAAFTQRRVKVVNALPVEVTNQYTLVPGSVWIKANLLAANAPNDRYIGLKIKSGKISLTAPPVLQGANLILANITRATVELVLDQPQPSPKSKKKYGQDARDMQIKCPDQFNFSFGGITANKVDLASPAEWNLYGQSGTFTHQNKANFFSSQLNRLLIPYQYSQPEFEPKTPKSPLFNLEGNGKIKQSWWAIPAAVLDVNAPLTAAGTGAMVADIQPGLSASWEGAEGDDLMLNDCQVLVENNRISLTSLGLSGEGAFHILDHWKDQLNPHGTQVELTFPTAALFYYECQADGVEAVLTQTHATVNADRPKQVNGQSFLIKTKNSILMLAGGQTNNLIYLIDDNILWDNKLEFDKMPKFKSLAIALENALFTVSPVNGIVLFGKCDENWKKITESNTFLVFGLFGYLPTLPDPYLANFGMLRGTFGSRSQTYDHIQNWFFCRIVQTPVPDEFDEVKVTFHNGPQANPNSTVGSGIGSEPPLGTLVNATGTGTSAGGTIAGTNVPDYEGGFNSATRVLTSDVFALLDVSSNANQLGVSLGGSLGARKGRVVTGHSISHSETEASIQQANEEVFTVDGMEMKVPANMARIFMLPQVAWEPVINTYKEGTHAMDPPEGFNYYPNDGGPSRILTNNPDKVTLAPIPLSQFILEKFKEKKTDVYAQFTLPFGLKSVAILDQTQERYPNKKPLLEQNSPKFPQGLIGGIQIRAIGGDAGALWPEKWMNDSDMFAGFTTQLCNVLDSMGQSLNKSTLGDSVTRIFNGQFASTASEPKGVPVVNIDFSGYGASTFSNWFGPSAEIAATSQARFDIMLGRTAHEVIQVKSLVYPWGIRVVRTITIFRASSGFVYRMDSGWQPETDGQFDFRYKYKDNGVVKNPTPYVIHPGAVRGLYSIRNIKEDSSIADFSTSFVRKNGDKYIDIKSDEQTWTGPNTDIPVLCRPVWFDADVELENLVQGHKNNRTPARKILGYVQLSPPLIPLSPRHFKDLLNTQGGIIGGDIDCVMDVNKSGQYMRITRFDFSHAEQPGDADPAFVVSARGSVILPKTGSWSVVQHQVGTGDVTPLPQHIPVPLIREGKWIAGKVVSEDDVKNNLIRLANPSEILKDPTTTTLNYGILQTTATQKALVLTPSFGFQQKKLFSKTPLLFADPYSLMSGNGIFPNAGNAIDEYGKAMPLLTGTGSGLNKVKAFKESQTFEDAGVKVLELMAINVQKEGQSVVDQGFELLAGKANEGLNKALAFDVPPFKTTLVEMESLKIYIEYATVKKRKNEPDEFVDSKLNFDINSFANAAADTWKSRLNNVAMVVDLGIFEGLMKIKGNFDAKKGKESGYEGGADSEFPSIGYPSPEIEFHPALQPVIDLLEILASLSQGKYADVMKKGLQIAMSNAGEIWEYKFEAKKEIPVVRFPPEENLYNSPTTPLKLEAGLELGVYFNAALKVTTDPKQLLPTAGAYIQFRGGLEVMCATVGVGTIFAIGEVILKLACDTKVGPSVSMNFGFGVSIAVGLPVIGTVSVTYMVGCELYMSTDKFSITAVMLFRGKARLAGGLVSVTIYIEAKGKVERKNLNTLQERTDCTASVTFGLDISICFIINISFEETWQESRQIA